VPSSPISPELALIDPTMGARDIKEEDGMIVPIDPGGAILQDGSNNGAETAGSQPSAEALLFNAGAISADQLGELVRDAVLTQRPVSAVAIERGLATPEMLETLSARARTDQPFQELTGEADPGLRPVGAPELTPELPMPVTVAPSVPAGSPPEVVIVQPHAAEPIVRPSLAQVEPAPAAVVTASPPAAPALPSSASDPDLAAAPAMPVQPLHERVREAVANAASSQPAAPTAADTSATALPSTETAPESFAVRVRLTTGEQLAVEMSPTFDSAAELARSLAGRFSRGGEWPLLGGRCVRPEAVVSIDIERALES
jgi:hypothetical protein